MAKSTNAPLYVSIAMGIERQIREGVYRLGDAVPSLRELKTRHRVSMATALQAYFWLENRGWIEARPKSGFYVRSPFSQLIPEPERPVTRAAKPTEITIGALVAEVVSAAGDPTKTPLGAACCDPLLMPNDKLSAIIRRLTRRRPAHSAQYLVPSGLFTLRQQIAKRCHEGGYTISGHDVLVTNGAMEALNLALRAVAPPGSVVATESPTYFGILQSLESHGVRGVEVSTDPKSGIDLNDLEDVIRKHHIRAVLAMPNCHNPLGLVAGDEKKRDLVRLLSKHGVPLIEDEVYADLAHNEKRPRSCKAFDNEGLVLVCSSFSKTIAPGLRVGWVHGGRFHQEVQRLKLISTIANASLPQYAVAEFLESGGYDRHIRFLRNALQRHVVIMSQAIASYLPKGTRMTRPNGGYVLWVELPEGINSIDLHRAALREGISISPGPIFSVSGRFRNCIRISCGHAWSDRIESALDRLGRLCLRQLK